MRLLLVSTYELGRQPVHLASPARRLRNSGHHVETVDISTESWDSSVLDRVDAVAISVPMHTAMRLGTELATQIKASHPSLPVAMYGLYAGVSRDSLLESTADRLIAGEYEDELLAWAQEPGERGFTSSVAKTESTVPDRFGLPQLDRYARLEFSGGTRLVGAVEASHGCRHRCRHCPIPTLFDGRIRLAGVESVLSDIDQLVDAGAEHVTFGDPDFLNAPRYSLDLLAEAHRRHPGLTFDGTIKVTHILQHRRLFREMAGFGLLFVVSAYETVDRVTLDILDKNHSPEDMSEATAILRSSGVSVRPTWLPFFPWTELSHVVGMVEFLDEHRLWEATDPVQLSLKVLVPQGSLLESHPAMKAHLTGYDPDALTWEWSFASPAAGLLQKKLDAIAAEGSDCGREALATLDEMRSLIARTADLDLGPMPRSGAVVPRLTESWFCCAEPTTGQAISIGSNLHRVPWRDSQGAS